MSTSRARVLLTVCLVAVLVITLLVVRQVGELRVTDEVGSLAPPTSPVDGSDADAQLPSTAPDADAPPGVAGAPDSSEAPDDGAPDDGAPADGAPADDGRSPPPGVPDDAQRATVDRVVDGDTVRVAVAADASGPIPPTDSVPVRLLTIDTPETVHPQRDVECGGPEATARAEELMPAGATVWLGRDVSDTDRFDRYLRVVWTADGTNVNATLVAEGLAEAVRYPPDERWYDEFAGLEDAARVAGRGNWTRCAA